MEFGILGPLEVRDQGREVELGGNKQRSGLVALLEARRAIEAAVASLAAERGTDLEALDLERLDS